MSRKLIGVVGIAIVLTAAFAATASNQNRYPVEKIGPTYPIAEPHAIKEILAKLQEKQNKGQLEQLQRDAQQRINQAALNQAPVQGLDNVRKSSVRHFKPVFTLPENVYDQDGRIVAVAGSSVNPLEVAPIPFKMLFFDGREASQVELARKLAVEHGESFLPILTAGQWDVISAELNQAVYFDQKGRMSQSFQLTEVPSLVSQEADQIKIEAIKP